MMTEARNNFNKAFTENSYQTYQHCISSFTAIEPPFRLAETPIFIPDNLLQKMTDTCTYIINQIGTPEFTQLSEASLPNHFRIAGDEGIPKMMVFDFGICKNKKDESIPMLIEMQGFPSLFGFQVLMDECMRKSFGIPGNFTSYLNGYTKETYQHLLQNILLGGHPQDEVILLEWKPLEQKTYIDFICTKKYWGIETVCLTELKAEGDQLYYTREGNKMPIKRIFNRIIFDDLKNEELQHCISFNHEYEVEWVIHPNWYYRISKHSLPFLRHPFIPDTFFLNEIKQPIALDEFVLKPLFSYGGQGVEMKVTKEMLDEIESPDQWLLQRKVDYASIVETPDGLARAEVRLFYFWDDEAGRYASAHNLARISKGEMIGTRYNLDKTWVGGSIAFFERS